jgi:hypothetical protein
VKRNAGSSIRWQSIGTALHASRLWFDEFARPRLVGGGCLLFAVPLLSGCYAAQTSVYPPGWSQATAISPEECPDIAGRYLNAGIGSPGFASNMKHFCSGYPSGFGRRPSWICEIGLADNLVNDASWRSARTIDIQQPDRATLVISVPDEPSSKPRTLSRAHGDFGCDASGFTMSRSGSDMNAVSTVISVLVLHFGIASSSRSFRPLSDGSLLMDLTNAHYVTQEILGTGTIKGQGFVRWERDRDEVVGEKPPGSKGSSCRSGAECSGDLICAADVCVESGE